MYTAYFRRFSTVIFLWFVAATSLLGQSKGEVLVVTSINFEDYWSKDFYSNLQLKLAAEGYTVRSEELIVPVLSGVEEAIERRDVIVRTAPRPSLVVFVGDPSWVIFREAFDHQWKDIPALLTYAQDSIPNSIEGIFDLSKRELVAKTHYQKHYNFTAVDNPHHIRQTIDLMQEVMPGISSLAFICDHRYISEIVLRDVRRTLETHFPYIELKLLRSPQLSIEGLMDSLALYDRSVGVLYYSWYLTKNVDERSYLDSNVEKIVSAFSRNPIFVLTDKGIGIGDFAGGHFTPVNSLSHRTIEVACSILNGARASDIPISIVGTPKRILNYLHLQTHNISPELFPTDVTYVNAPPSFLERNAALVSLLVSLFILLSASVLLWFYLSAQKNRQRKKEIQWLKQYRLLIDSMPVAYLRRQALPEGDYLLLTVNVAFEKAFGCHSRDIVGHPYSQLKPHYPQLQQLFEPEQLSDGAIHLYDADGVTNYYEIMTFRLQEQDVDELFCIDRTQRYTAAIELARQRNASEEANRKFRLALIAGNMQPWVWDLENGTIVVGLDETKHCFEMKKQLFYEKDITKQKLYFHPEDCERIVAAYTDLIEGRTEILHEEYRAITPAGTYLWVVSGAIVADRNEAGEPISITGATYDINSHKCMEEELRRAKEEAEESSRIKSTFIANMSHEIRTPLNSIVGFSEMIALAETDEERKEYAKLVTHNNQLLLQLVDDVLELSRIDSGTTEPQPRNVDVQQLLAQVAMRSELTNFYNKNIEVRLLTDGQPLHMFIDSALLIRVFSNLLSNALKFTSEGVVSFGFNRVGANSIEFFVADTGCGIPTAKLGSIFDRFVKIDAFAQGTGLGLTICWELVKMLEGTIRVASEVGVGSTFTFTLPIHPEHQ